MAIELLEKRESKRKELIKCNIFFVKVLLRDKTSKVNKKAPQNEERFLTNIVQIKSFVCIRNDR